MSRRAVEIGTAVQNWWKLGGRVAFMTFTVRHNSGDSLETVWGAISRAWSRAVKGKAWQTDKERHGVEGYLRVIEVTQGLNGWHVHVHALVFLRAGVGSSSDLQASMFRRWSAGAVAAGLRAPLSRAQDVQVLTGNERGRRKIAEYLSKAQYNGSLGQELTNTQSKAARSTHSTRSTWEILDGARDGLATEVGLWGVWETASRGKRQIAWSRGLRELLGVGKEAADEEIAAEELGSDDDTLAWITPDGWTRMLELEQLAECLEQATKGRAALVRWLVGNRVEHELVRN